MTSQQFNWLTPNEQEPCKVYYYNTPAGQLTLNTKGEVLCNMQWLTQASASATDQAAPEILSTQLTRCWLEPQAKITLSLLSQGSTFQRKVWDALRKIPIGQTKTYGELARELNTSPRALANACRKNPFPLIIPCHRVLAKTGIGGYAGEITGKLIEIKTALLDYEKMITHAS